MSNPIKKELDFIRGDKVKIEPINWLGPDRFPAPTFGKVEKMKKIKVERMKKAICDCIASRGAGTSFVELGRYVPGFKFEGEGGYELSFRKNLIIWAGVSEEAAEAIIQLRTEKKVSFKPTTPFIYMIDGEIPNMPLAKRDMEYKKPRWLPVALNLAT